MTEAEFRAVIEAAAKVCDKSDSADWAAICIRALTPKAAGITITEGVVVPREPTEAWLYAVSSIVSPYAAKKMWAHMVELTAAQEPR